MLIGFPIGWDINPLPSRLRLIAPLILGSKARAAASVAVPLPLLTAGFHLPFGLLNRPDETLIRCNFLLMEIMLAFVDKMGGFSASARSVRMIFSAFLSRVGSLADFSIGFA